MILPLILTAFILFGCGAKVEDSPTTYKITVSQTEIKHNTLVNDTGNKNRINVIVSIFNIQDNIEKPATNGTVKVSYGETNFVKLYDSKGNYIQSGNSFNVNTSEQITVEYETRARPTPLEYISTINLTYQNANTNIKLIVIKPETATYSLKTLPDKIEDKSEIGDKGTWNYVNATIFLTAKDLPIQDSIFIFCNNDYIKLTDIKGNDVNQKDVLTDINGRFILVIGYYTKEKLKYNTSIQVFYGNTSTSIPIRIDAEEITTPNITTTVTPAEFSFKAPSDDTGSWRTSSFLIQTKSDNKPISADVNVSVTSEYMKVYGAKTYTIKTNSNGLFMLDVQYYTQSTPSMIEYIGYLMVAENIIKFDITATKPSTPKITTTVTPNEISFDTPNTDTGTWRVQSAVISTKDENNNGKSTTVTIQSSNTNIKINGLQSTTITTNSFGIATVDINYYTEFNKRYLGYVTFNDFILKVNVK